METLLLDAKGLKCPTPALKLTVLYMKAKPGDFIEVIADCPTFEGDMREWCTKMNKTLLWVRDDAPGVKRCRIKV